MHDQLNIIYEAMTDDKVINDDYFTEGLSLDGQYRLNRMVTQYGLQDAAIKLVNLFIGRLTGGQSASFQGNSSEYADGLTNIIQNLKRKSLDIAVKLAKETAEVYITNNIGMEKY